MVFSEKLRTARPARAIFPPFPISFPIFLFPFFQIFKNLKNLDFGLQRNDFRRPKRAAAEIQLFFLKVSYGRQFLDRFCANEQGLRKFGVKNCLPYDTFEKRGEFLPTGFSQKLPAVRHFWQKCSNFSPAHF